MANSAGGVRSEVLVRSAIFTLALGFIALGFLIPEPFVFPWRSVAIATLTATALAVCVVLTLSRYRWWATLFVLAAAFALWQGEQPWMAKKAVLARNGADLAGIERHFVVGYDDLATVREMVRDGHVGGIFLTRRNVVGKTAPEVADEIGGLQSIRREAGLPPLIVTADQEGGPVSHLSPPLPNPPALSTLTALPSDQQRAAARRIGTEQGAALKAINITMDLAPVVDLKPLRDSGTLDLYTRIATRAISSDPGAVARIAAGFSEGLLASGIVPTAKHFPGLGRVTVDTHLFGTSLNAAPADLYATDWIPFRAVLGIRGAAVMLSHVALEGVDAGVPVSQSKPAVADLLRRQWGFNGIAITDDLTMGAVQHGGFCRAIEGALNAGIDLLLVSWDTDKIYPALRCALDASDAGRLDRETLQRSEQRLDQLATIGAK